MSIWHLPSTVLNLPDIEIALDNNKTPCVGHLLPPLDQPNLWDHISLLSPSLPCPKKFFHNESLRNSGSFFACKTVKLTNLLMKLNKGIESMGPELFLKLKKTGGDFV